MSNRSFHLVTPDILLRAYAAGIFPMAESAEATELHWFDPPVRAMIPLDERFMCRNGCGARSGKKPYTIKLDTAFGDVMRACAAPAPGRPRHGSTTKSSVSTTRCHRRGHAHSIEAWDGGELVGGLYGVSAWAALFSAKACSAARPTPARSRWSIWWRCLGVAALPARYAVSDAASGAVRHL